MTELPRKILVPVDGSDPSGKALELALSLAGSTDATVTVFQVREDIALLYAPTGLFPTGSPGIPTAFMNSAMEARFKRIKPVLEGTKVKWERKVVEGFPADTICSFAEKENYDLIVIGSRGLGAVSRFVLGSISDRVLHHAHCDVVIAR